MVTHLSGELGVMQGDAIRNIRGELSGNGSLYAAILSHGRLLGGSATGPFRVTRRYSYGALGDPSNGSYDMEFDAEHVVPTATENRPVNMAVRYLIRAQP